MNAGREHDSVNSECEREDKNYEDTAAKTDNRYGEYSEIAEVE